MIRPSVGSRDFSRRAFERISIIVIEPVSSTQIGAFISLSHAAVRRGQSSGFSLPVRRLCDSTFASLHIMPLRHLALRHLEREQRHGTSCRTARFCAMFSASADFPIDGRAATMIRFPGWKPEVSLSSSLKPVGQPVTSAPASYRCMIRSKLSFSSPSMWLKSLVTRCWARSKTICSARSTRSVVSPGRSCPSRAISAPARTSAAERRHLPDDPRIVRGVRRGGDERGELVDAGAAADLLELAALLERVDERDGVDRLALLVQREAGAEDDPWLSR